MTNNIACGLDQLDRTKSGWHWVEPAGGAVAPLMWDHIYQRFQLVFADQVLLEVDAEDFLSGHYTYYGPCPWPEPFLYLYDPVQK